MEEAAAKNRADDVTKVAAPNAGPSAENPAYLPLAGKNNGNRDPGPPGFYKNDDRNLTRRCCAQTAADCLYQKGNTSEVRSGYFPGGKTIEGKLPVSPIRTK